MSTAPARPYRLCVQDNKDDIAWLILGACVEAVAQKFSGSAPAALVLTGSFSRGEGSIVLDGQGGAAVLGDMEFFVVLTENSSWSEANDRLAVLSQSVEEVLLSRQIRCKVEFSPVARHYFRRMRPSIFNFELLKHGKVVWGKTDLLQEIPAFDADSIPREDGFFLLCNRMIEQLMLTTRGGQDPSHFSYQILKLYLDMAGSYLVVSGRYTPTYAQRAGGFFDAISSDNVIASAERSRLFSQTLHRLTDYKLDPAGTCPPLLAASAAPESLKESFRQAAAYSKDFWQFEIRALFGSADRGLNWTVSANRYFSRLCLAREWLKFFLLARRAGRKLSLLRALRQCASGTPRTLIYAAACQLYFDSAEGKVSDLKSIQQLLPVPCALDSNEAAVDAVIDLWNTYVRSA